MDVGDGVGVELGVRELESVTVAVGEALVEGLLAEELLAGTLGDNANDELGKGV